MGCTSSHPEIPDPNDISNPADVSCSVCGVSNYIEPKRRQVSCFKCQTTISRFERQAQGIVNQHSERIKEDRAMASFRRSTAAAAIG